MIIRNINLETVCGITSKLPENTLPEIAFAGKSNVGKSSLINALMNRKSYARISATPGKTQTINFYNINEALYLVDLPGYGYAKVSEQEKIKWGQLIERYLHGSKQLKVVFLLIDIRHKPSGNDKMMYEWIVSHGFHQMVINEIKFVKGLTNFIFFVMIRLKYKRWSKTGKKCENNKYNKRKGEYHGSDNQYPEVFYS